MIPIAFFAPLKSPEHTNPSGDREIARALLRALRHAGFAPSLASELRLLDRAGDADVQANLAAQAEAQLPELIARGQREGWRLWLTYHNYYKAPDLLGPRVASALSIPYVQVESTRARKRLTGPWAVFAAGAEAAADAAQVIFFFTHRDAVALRQYAPVGQRQVHLHPFLPRETLPVPSTRDGPLLAVGMMREGDKLQSYQLLADALALVEREWEINIAGDGEARSKVERMMAPFASRVRFLGRLDRAGMNQAYGRARLMVWPGVNEAIGLNYLEAQSFGIPVLAQDRPGLCDVIAPSLPRPSPETGARGLADTLMQMLCEPPDATPIRDHIASHHLLPAAARNLRHTLGTLIEAAA